MAKWVMEKSPKTVLDPAFGLGIFYEEINKIALNLRKKTHFTGYEIDQRILRYLNISEKEQKLTIINEDYLESDVVYFDAIICNPPYIKFQKFIQRHNVLPIIEQQIGKKLGGYSNLSSVFLAKALKQLNTQGRLAFIMPFEFFNTGYGKEIKKSLLDNYLLKQIVIFDNEKDIFPDVTTTICMLLCENNRLDEPIKITHIMKNEELEKIDNLSRFYQYTINRANLPFNKKWTPIILSLFFKQEIPDGFCQLSIYGKFIRGIATGANEFFALTPSKIEEFNLERQDICKCITKSQLIRQSVFTHDDFLRLHSADKPVYCLDVTDAKKQAVLNYIRLGEEMKYHERYLTKHRTPWYKIEERIPSPVLFGVFNRGRLKVIRNYTEAVNFTCYHSFYPNLFGENVLNKIFLYLFSDIGQKIIQINKRSYGGKLEKFEPNDLNESYCPNIEQFKLIKNEEAAQVIEVAKSNEDLAIKMSNQLIERIINNSNENNRSSDESGRSLS
jgi:adenine-specific DNA-methyltransferase